MSRSCGDDRAVDEIMISHSINAVQKKKHVLFFLFTCDLLLALSVEEYHLQCFDQTLELSF
jgi:hypothetical protein